MLFVHLERRFDPLFRSAFDFLFRELFTLATNAFINLQRKNEGYKLAEERIQPDEEAHLNDIIATMSNQMRRLWRPGDFQRCGNTKTHGIVRGEVVGPDGRPVAGATVRMMEQNFTTNADRGQTMTHDDGSFEFTDNRSHYIQLRAEKPGLGRSPLVEVRLYFRAQNVTLKEPLRIQAEGSG